MGSIGIWQIVIIAVVVVLLFGRGKISELMGDVAKGINSFKKGLNEDTAEAKEKAEDPKVIDHAPGESVNAQTKAEDTAKKD
ncbi:Twin-arginine translocation protein TatA/E [Pseudovibrio sp. FO-BEG1]|uniref:Sec-independent protein translocase protein TatA n=1 Tax=Pseudovibrio denitrificans TaxID=258256 RepID=A0A1I6XBE6_9HYPH|nr:MULTISPECIES: twin-arginine translocase TatA/TatE family subunit [Pseudovibrio]AEV37748.1 Twin-arginine translocation protein TatA/E [Pseudovibrio sp. FO-BEG1]SFT35476.1 sec-independent protein translocase protein TatA [Pseudovibrio denitrificans]